MPHLLHRMWQLLVEGQPDRTVTLHMTGLYWSAQVARQVADFKLWLKSSKALGGGTSESASVRPSDIGRRSVATMRGTCASGEDDQRRARRASYLPPMEPGWNWKRYLSLVCALSPSPLAG